MNKRYASILALGVVSGATWAQQAHHEVRTPYAPVERRGHSTAIDKASRSGYGSPKWHDAPPSGATKLSLNQYRELVIARKL